MAMGSRSFSWHGPGAPTRTPVEESNARRREEGDGTMAFTATKDLMLPATVTGSWPRPRWYTQNMWGRPLDTAMMDPWYREQFTDAHAVVVSDQERTGLDILTTGDYHLDEDVAGRSWHHYPLQRWKGLEHEELQYERSRDRLLEFPAGTLMNEIETTWRWPRVVGRVEHDPRNPLEERYGPAADPSLQVDVLPDREPLTHLLSPWK